MGIYDRQAFLNVPFDNRYKKAQVPSSALLVRRYVEFRRQLPFICRMESSTPAELTFLDYKRLVTYWLDENP